jgi:hypothetical protein
MHHKQQLLHAIGTVMLVTVDAASGLVAETNSTHRVTLTLSLQRPKATFSMQLITDQLRFHSFWAVVSG